jgi:trans-aconitate methyltransferase
MAAFDNLEEGNPFLVLQGPDNFFSCVEYWDERYVRKLNQQEEVCEWYSVDLELLKSHESISELLAKAKENQWKILDIGCGNSGLTFCTLSLYLQK